MTIPNPVSQVAPFVRGAPTSTKYTHLFRVISHCIPFVRQNTVFWFLITMPGNNFAINYRKAPIIESRGERRGERAANGYLRSWIKVFKWNEILRASWKEFGTMTTGYVQLNSVIRTSFIMLYIQWYQLIQRKALFSAMLNTTFISSSNSDITTLPIIISSRILQEVGYFRNSTLSSSLRNQAFHSR
jgi:hypothetical protein